MEAEYDNQTIKFLEQVWGVGYLSPGGTEEVDKIVNRVPLGGKQVMDLGCGAGGITLYLAEKYDVANIVGFDVEQPSITLARQRQENSPAAMRVDFIQGAAGALPFADNSFHVIFSKDALIHVPDKHFIVNEIFRTLKPGGTFVASDWLISSAEKPSQNINNWLESEGFEFLPGTQSEYESAMQTSGFSNLEFNNRNAWHKNQITDEIEYIANARYDQLVAEFGLEYVTDQLNAWRYLQVVADSGELFPMHLYGEKP